VYFLNDVSTFTTIYYAYFHSVMKYGIIFQGNKTLDLSEKLKGITNLKKIKNK
jgi:hypothetical protein